jgi:DNA-binding MarR family transcriptional regulator
MSKKTSISDFSERLNKTISDIHRHFQSTLKNQADPFIKGKITFPQYIALEVLSETGGVKMKNIARMLHITLPATTGLIDRLVTLGMVKRVSDDNDRRVIFIMISPSGLKVVENVRSARKKIIEKMFSVLTDSERDTYLKIITKVRNTINEKRTI